MTSSSSGAALTTVKPASAITRARVSTPSTLGVRQA